jgi:hypothetical protein
MPTLVHLPADTPAADVTAVLTRDGGLILDDALSPAEVDALVAELRPYVEATEPGRDAFSGQRTTRTGALAARSPLTRPLLMDARIHALCDAVLKPNCLRYQLHLTQLIRIMPGQGAQPLHRDTQVVPGSVEWPDDRRAERAEIARAEMRRGSVLVYTGSVFHGGGANESSDERWGLNITYTLGWLRQEENQYLSCPPEIARTLDPELQGLLGYSMGSYALGYFTPPLPPGEGPEVAPPEFALGGGRRPGSSLGGQELYEAAAAHARPQELVE